MKLLFLFLLVALVSEGTLSYQLDHVNSMRLCREFCNKGITYTSCSCQDTWLESVKYIFQDLWRKFVKWDRPQVEIIKIELKDLKAMEGVYHWKKDLPQNNGGRGKYFDNGGIGGYNGNGSTTDNGGMGGYNGNNGNGGIGGYNGNENTTDNGGMGGYNGNDNSTDNGGSGNGSGMSIPDLIAWIMEQDVETAIDNIKKAIQDCDPSESAVFLYLFPNGTLSFLNCTQPSTTTILPTTTQENEDPMVAFCHEACLSGNGGVSCNCAQHPIG